MKVWSFEEILMKNIHVFFIFQESFRFAYYLCIYLKASVEIIKYYVCIDITSYKSLIDVMFRVYVERVLSRIISVFS